MEIKKWMNDNAQMAAILGVILFIIVAIIGVTLLSSTNQALYPSLNKSDPTIGTAKIIGDGYGWNTSFLGVITNSTSGYNLLGVAVIIIAAAVIIGVLVSGFAFGRRES